MKLDWNYKEPEMQALYGRLNELVDNLIITNSYDPNQLDITMSTTFMLRFLYQMFNDKESAGTLRRTKKGWSRYHPDGYLDFRFRVDHKLPGNTFKIRLKG